MSNLVPGGYLLTNIVFWIFVAMIAVGTMAVGIILSIGLGILAKEGLEKG